MSPLTSADLPSIRRATAADARAVAEIWRTGWHDAHIGNVPDALVDVRTDGSFDTRATERVADTSVAVVRGDVAGFVMVVGDEVEQVYVSRDHRGTGIADLLLDSAERQVAASSHAVAWLAVATGNARARHFYERRGWSDEGAFAYPAPGPDGPIDVACHRYTKRVVNA
ncbi:MAG TPA: GNAT family N-acetyltransferase [Nocardioidaceae bacterium]|nr:GNAT family N-acetyltransferase [Nocardioidaceae bacterium]